MANLPKRLPTGYIVTYDRSLTNPPANTAPQRGLFIARGWPLWWTGEPRNGLISSAKLHSRHPILAKKENLQIPQLNAIKERLMRLYGHGCGTREG